MVGVKEFMIGYYFRTDVKHYTLRYLHVRHGKIHSLDWLRVGNDHCAMYHTIHNFVWRTCNSLY